MSLGEADAKFPGHHDYTNAIPPSPSRENPGQVFPKSDPTAAPAQSIPGTGCKHEPQSFMGNPYALAGVFSKLDIALNEAISTVAGEERSVGSSTAENAMLQKFKSWRTELAALRTGYHKEDGAGNESIPQEGGMFTD